MIEKDAKPLIHQTVAKVNKKKPKTLAVGWISKDSLKKFPHGTRVIHLYEYQYQRNWDNSAIKVRIVEYK